ncbi:MAG: TonB-dependent receptor [Telmatospirillum sp.]|nr:TonB-dependent receptor [Telmatospirillum sp.]
MMVLRGFVTGVRRQDRGMSGRWARLLATTALGGLCFAGTAVAEVPAAGTAVSANDAAAGHGQATSRAFDIPAQPLAGALTEFSRQSGLQVTMDSAVALGRTSTAIHGSMSPSAALSRLLGGTGIAWQMIDGRTVSLTRAAPGQALALDPVRVEGQGGTPARGDLGNPPPAYAGGQVAAGARVGMLGNRDIMNTPFAVTSYTAELMENQEARTLAAILENDPSVRFTTSGGHAYENFQIRGFEVDAGDVALNGLYGMAPDGHVPTEFLERAELLKGPTALLSGMAPGGGVGGAVNLVPKRAGDAPVTSVTVDYTSDSQVGTHVDVGRRFGTDDRFGVRINGAFRDGDSGLDGQSKERDLGALALDYRGENLRLSFDGFAMRESFDGGSPMMVNFDSSVKVVPKAPDASNNSFRGIWAHQENLGGIARAEYDVTGSLTAYGALGAHDYDFDGFLNSTHALNTTATGAFQARTTSQKGYTHSRTGEAGLRGRFETGPVNHEAVISANWLRTWSGMRFNRSRFIPSNIYNPVTPILAPMPADPLRTSASTLAGVAVADTLSALDDRVALTVGVRQQSVNSKSFNSDTGAETSSYDKSEPSPSVGLVVKPFDAPLSIYGNYIEGLTKGSQVTDTDAANYGHVFAPFRTRQQEIGVKWELGHVTNTLSVFQILQPGLSSNRATHLYTQSAQRNRGIEWTVAGQIVQGVRVLGGATYLDSELRNNADPGLNGKTPYGVPDWQVNAGVEWDTPFATGLTLEGRVVYTGRQYANSADTMTLPEWSRFDLGARYVLPVRGNKVTLRGYVTNLLDSSDYTGAFNDNFATLNTPRTFMLSTTVDF